MHRTTSQPNTRPLISLLLISGMLSFASCSSGPTELNPDPELKEILADKKNDIDSPEGALFESAKKSYHNRLFSVAKDQFTALQNNFPTGPYAEYSELKVADCSFFVRDYDISAALYEEYAKSHPGSLSAAYALLMSARSFHLSSKGVGHDAHALERAREMYSRLLEQYPDSVYSKQAALYQQAAIDDLTANEMRVAEFYRKQGKEEAYHARLKIIREKWQPLSKAAGELPESESSPTTALGTIPVIESAERVPVAEASPEGAQSTLTTPVEGDSATEVEEQVEEQSQQKTDEDLSVATEETVDSEVTPETEEVVETEEVAEGEEEPEPLQQDESQDDALRLEAEEEALERKAEEEERAAEEAAEKEELAASEQEEEEQEDESGESEESAPIERPTPSSLRVTRPVPAPDGPEPVKLVAPQARISIKRVECVGSVVYLHLDLPWQDSGFLARFPIVQPIDGVISLTLPLTRAEEKKYNCFGISDLLVTSNGTVTVESSKPMFVRAMKNPSRLALITKNFPAN